MAVNFVDGVLCMYWRLILDKPQLDMDDTRAIAAEWTKNCAAATRPEDSIGRITRSETPMWRTAPR